MKPIIDLTGQITISKGGPGSGPRPGDGKHHEKYKMGDKVKVNIPGHPFYHGAKGTVTESSKTGRIGNRSVRVLFDKPVNTGTFPAYPKGLFQSAQHFDASSLNRI